MQTDTIVAGCVAGDRRCQQQLFRRYRDRVLGLVARSLGSRFDIDDVVQQVFIRLFRSLQNFEERSSLDTWVYRITAKVCTDQLRHKYRKRRLDVVSDTSVLEQKVEASDHGNPDRVMEQKELRSHIRDGLERLSAHKRMVLVLYEMDGKSLEEIAEVVKTPVGTVKSRLFHARREMERFLAKYLAQ